MQWSDAVTERDAKSNGYYVVMPKWVLALCAGGLSLVCTAMLAWAVNIDTTQRDLLSDVSSLKEHKIHVTEQLDRIENKLDKLLDK